ncbi:MAG: gamma-glutamylcyclotransferase [Erysipelotrichia bacterium]|nr:gamma-glutamylcyclotransferase [Erysipelotrichia bacterium]
MNKYHKLYGAYGSNLNFEQMLSRCPDAAFVGVTMLKGWQLTFRTHATLERDEKGKTPIGVWGITQSDENELDLYEGFPSYYRKEMITVELNGKTVEAMIYLMNGKFPRLPSEQYYKRILKGYADANLDMTYLENALTDTEMRIGKKNNNGEDIE